MANILIVDDEKDLADIIGDFLEFEGHKAKAVTDGHKAIDQVKTTHYDLVLMDIRLPDINGVETFLKIKEIDPRVRVMSLTEEIVPAGSSSASVSKKKAISKIDL